MKKKLAWICLMLSPLVLGSAALCFFNRDTITQANCDKIKKGMTKKEVEAILGREHDGKYGKLRIYQAFYWIGSSGKIVVEMEFLDPLFVNDAFFMPFPPQSILEKARNWLGFGVASEPVDPREKALKWLTSKR